MEQHLLDLYRETVPAENFDLIPIQFVCDVFGIDSRYQTSRLSKDDSYNGMILQKANLELFNDSRKRYHLSKKGFIKFIMQLVPSAVKKELADQFVEYQNNILDYLYNNAIEQESILRKAESLKRKRDDLYDKLHAQSEDFVQYMNCIAEIARLGKDNKLVQQRIASGQTRLDL